MRKAEGCLPEHRACPARYSYDVTTLLPPFSKQHYQPYLLRSPTRGLSIRRNSRRDFPNIRIDAIIGIQMPLTIENRNGRNRYPEMGSEIMRFPSGQKQ
jgi:hypothetical protein